MIKSEKLAWAKYFLGVSDKPCPHCGGNNVYYSRCVFCTHYRCAFDNRAWFVRGVWGGREGLGRRNEGGIEEAV